jgi:hypothetical protein
VTLQFQQEWQPTIGEFVEVRLNFDVVRTGYVDAVTHDDQILWIAADGLLPRMMFERSNGYHLWVHSAWEQRRRDLALNRVSY